jgi:lipopolysaccharide transport system ATP-binding protein
MNDFAIEARNLSKSYKLYDKNSDRLKEALNPFGKKYHQVFDALRNINFTVGRGEVLGIIGRNGAGKSTLLKIISGILTQSGGQCNVNGRVSALLELGTGFNPELTGVENIHFNGIIKGFSPEEIDDRMERIIEFADIGQFMYQPIKMYSSGMKARLGFAMAIHIDPEILIVDEALSVGDELFKRKCYARIQNFMDEGKTILFVTHSLSTINELCTRAIMLDKGELILEGHPKLVTTHYLKLLYSTLRERPIVRESIITLNKDQAQKDTYAQQLVREELDKDSDKLLYDHERKEAESANMQSFYIESFQSSTTIQHKTPAVDLFDLEIQTPDGQKVNALVMNEDYICTFKVKFNVSLQFVSFNVKIKSVKGINVSGIRFPKNNTDFPRVKKGEVYRFDWRFNCKLVPKSYFVNITMSNFSDGEKIQLLHLADALAFKVQDMEHCSLGIVDLDNTCKLTHIGIGN